MKGSKQCPSCSKSVGPRSRQCKYCGKGFIIKGVQCPDIDPSKLIKTSKDDVAIGQRGKKSCPQCQTINAARSQNCKFCGFGFTIKGYKCPDINPNTIKNKTKNSVPLDIRKTFKENFVKLETSKADKIKWGSKTKLWESKDGVYRIRYRDKFYGIDGKSIDNKSYIFLKWDHQNQLWDLVRPNHRFKKLRDIIKNYQINKELNSNEEAQTDSGQG